MPKVIGFKALRYNPELFSDFSTVITPPYDIVTPEIRTTLSHRSPYNFIHIDLPEGDNKYVVAGNLFRKWLGERVFIRDSALKAYWLRQRFIDMRGLQFERLALFALVEICGDEKEQHILAHEETFKKPVEDRIALMETTRAQLSPIFLLYSDPHQEIKQMFNEVSGHSPEMSFVTYDGTVNEVWISDWKEELTEFFKDKLFYIADGHHRFKTAQYWLKEQYKSHSDLPTSIPFHPYQFVFSGLVALQDSGLIIYSPHRVLSALDGFSSDEFIKKSADYFIITRIDENPVEYLLKKENQCKDKFSFHFGVIIKNKGRFIFELKESVYENWVKEIKTKALHQVGVFVLHKIIFERIMLLPSDFEFIYETNPFRCIEMVDTGLADMAFLLCPISPGVIQRCAECREYMPQKATYFFPKLPSGVAIYELSLESLI